MAETMLAGKSERLESLDVFRGMTIAGMVLVNNPGTWGAMYDPLEHAAWDGCTPTDLIFPFFLFIVGVAMTFSFDKRIARGDDRMGLFSGVVRRSLLLVLLGLILGGFPNFRLIAPYILAVASLGFLYRDEPVLKMPEEPTAKKWKITGWVLGAAAVLWFIVDFSHFNGPTKSNPSFVFGAEGTSLYQMFPLGDIDGGYLRVPGVLKRIGVCFFFASIIVLLFKTWGRAAWTVGLLLFYWAVMALVPAPGGFEAGSIPGTVRDATAGAPFAGDLNDWIDVQLLGNHLYRHRPDPEGLLSTIPAIATILLGVLTGTWLHRNVSRERKAYGLLAAAIPLILLGYLWSLAFPLNKKIWSSSYVLYTAGWALVFFGICYYLNDVKGWKKWSLPFVVFGTNAILVFFGSGIMARLMGMIKWGTGEMVINSETGVATEVVVNLKTGIYKGIFEKIFTPGEMSSVAFAITFILLWLALTWPLYRKRIFLKV